MVSLTVLLSSTIAFSAVSEKPDTEVIETKTCPPQKIALQIEKQFSQSTVTADTTVISVADTTTGRSHGFENLIFQVVRKGLPLYGQIEFDSKKCAVGARVEFFKLRSVESAKKKESI